MIVFIGCYSGDEEMAKRVAALAGRCVGSHDIRLVKREDDGSVPALPGVKVTRIGWPHSCTDLFRQFALSLPEGAVFLNLEPDAVLTRLTALDELEEAMSSEGRYRPRLCQMGHWKTPPLTEHAPHEHYSGSSVYRLTPQLRRAVQRLNITKPWDLDLWWRNLLRPDMGCDTPLIRCFWRQEMDASTLTKYPRAALIHGDKRGVLLSHVESEAARWRV